MNQSKNVRIEPLGGDEFSEFAKRAKYIAITDEVTVEFNFNGIECIVDYKTDLTSLVNDYSCRLSESVKADMEKYGIKIGSRQERLVKDAAAKLKVEAMVNGVELELLPELQEEYKANVEKYSHHEYIPTVIQYIEPWAKLMQIEIANGKTVRQIVYVAEKHLSYMYIPGHMYFYGISLLVRYWKYGKELKEWHDGKK